MTEAVDLEASEVNVTPKIIPETNPIVTPEVTDEANPKVNSDVNNLEIVHETNLEVTPVEEELPLINLNDEENTSTQSIQTRISEDILSLDWDSYQKDLMEQELKRSLERQNIQTVHVILIIIFEFINNHSLIFFSYIYLFN
jgi:hypothetical protein